MANKNSAYVLFDKPLGEGYLAMTYWSNTETGDRAHLVSRSLGFGPVGLSATQYLLPGVHYMCFIQLSALGTREDSREGVVLISTLGEPGMGYSCRYKKPLSSLPSVLILIVNTPLH